MGHRLCDRDANTDSHDRPERTPNVRLGQARRRAHGATRVVEPAELSYAREHAEARQNALSAPVDAMQLVLLDELSADARLRRMSGRPYDVGSSDASA